MTKTDAEQHAAVWKLADDIVMVAVQKAQAGGSVELVAALLGASHLAEAVSKSYDTMAKALK
jgi:hypothetical protein